MAVMAARNPREEFTALYTEESDALFRFCYWRVSNRERALELSQEAFARLWVAMAAGQPMTHPRAFLYTVTRHLIIDWYRRSKSLSLESLSTDEDHPFEAADSKAEESIERDSDVSRAHALIEKLGAQYRDVVYLRFVEDLPPREIAERLGLSVNAVSVRLTRGVAELRRLSGITTLE
jgi:RNA polymerase sigma-70 factor (ECF subfamily)